MFGYLSLHVQKIAMGAEVSMWKWIHVIVCGAVVLLICARGAAAATVADVPVLLHYQARVAGADDVNVDGTVDAEVWLYDSATEGGDRDFMSDHLLFAESHASVRVDRGIMRMSIGDGTPLGRFLGTSPSSEVLAGVGDLFIQLYLNGEKVEPRQKVGYEFFAEKTEYARVADQTSGVLNVSSDSMPSIEATKTYGSLSAARIPHMSAGKITGTFTDSTFIPQLPLSKLASDTLETSVIGGIGTSNITEGTFASTVLPNGIMIADDLYLESNRDVADGTTVVIPAQYRFPLGGCVMVAGLQSFDLPGEGDGAVVADNLVVEADLISLFGIPIGYKINCDVINGGTRIEGCSASYLMVCKKN